MQDPYWMIPIFVCVGTIIGVMLTNALAKKSDLLTCPRCASRNNFLAPGGICPTCVDKEIADKAQ